MRYRIQKSKGTQLIYTKYHHNQRSDQLIPRFQICHSYDCERTWLISMAQILGSSIALDCDTRITNQFKLTFNLIFCFDAVCNKSAI